MSSVATKLAESPGSVARLRNVRIAPRKARLVVDQIRGQQVQTALDKLRLMNKRAAPVVAKLIESAIANMRQVQTIDVDRLLVDTAFVDEDKTFKRFLPRAQGRATPIRKRGSQITIMLREL